MQETILHHPHLDVGRRTGAEGPRHDPYAYEEFTVRTPSGETVLHCGLGTWLKHNGITIDPPAELTFDDAEKWLRFEGFPKMCGYSIKELQRWAEKIRSRCRKCGGREFHSQNGYPGEHFEVCAKCGEVVASFFCELEIE